MATGNLKGPLGPILLICLICLAGGLFYVVQSPDLEISSHPSRHDPAFLMDKTIVGLMVGAGAAALWGLFKFFRR